MVLSALSLLLCAERVQAQNSSLIGFSTYLETEPACLSENGTRALVSKIDYMIARNSAGAKTFASTVLFAIRPEIIVTVDRTANAGIGLMYIKEAKLTLSAISRADGSVFNSIVVNLSGDGSSKAEAERRLLDSFNPRAARFAQFIHASQQKIEEHFENITGPMCKQAEALAARGQYDEAVMLLSLIPSSTSAYDTVADLIAKFYSAKIELEAERIIGKARILREQGKEIEAMELLATVDPLCKAYKTTVRDEIAANKSAIATRKEAEAAERAAALEMEMEQKQRELDRQMALAKTSPEQMSLNAANQYAQQIPTDADSIADIAGVLMDCYKVCKVVL